MLIFNRGKGKQGKGYLIPRGKMVVAMPFKFQPNSFISFSVVDSS